MIYTVGSEKLLPEFTEVNMGVVIDYCKNKDMLAMDTETSGVDWNSKKILMFQIGDSHSQFVIDTRFVSINPLKEILESKLILAHNVKFDYKFILSNYGIRLKNVWDTMLAECVIHCGKKNVGYSLNVLCKRYLDKSLNKSTRSQFSALKNGQPFTVEQIEYGAKDVKYLIDIKNKQRDFIVKLELEEIVALENRAASAFAEIEYNGMSFDIEAWLKLAEKADKSYIKREKELDQLVLNDSKLQSFVLDGYQVDLFGAEPKKTNILWSSPSQVTKVLKVLDPQLQNTNMRELFKRQKKYPLIKTLIDYRKEGKLVTTYGKDFIKHFNKHSKRVHTLFWQILNTGRVSSGQRRSKTNPNQAPNMQNIPAIDKYRNCFKAEDGWKIVTMDYSGQELRLIAQGSQDPIWLKAFSEGKDVHGMVAALVFNVDINRVRNKPEFLRGKSYRDVAKTINFGLAYGMSYMKLADTLGIAQLDAKEFIDRYFNQLPSIKNFLKALGNYGKRNGYIKTFKPFKRLRWFEDHENLNKMTNRDRMIKLGKIERASKNTPIQGSGADMIKYALAMIIEHINDYNLHDKVKLISQVHDEISCEVKDNYVNTWVEFQKTIMLHAGKSICKDVTMVVDYTVSQKWSK